MLGRKATDAKFLQILIAAINVIGKDNNSNMNQFSPLCFIQHPTTCTSTLTHTQPVLMRFSM